MGEWQEENFVRPEECSFHDIIGKIFVFGVPLIEVLITLIDELYLFHRKFLIELWLRRVNFIPKIFVKVIYEIVYEESYARNNQLKHRRLPATSSVNYSKNKQCPQS
jgi:hypothetical protein